MKNISQNKVVRSILHHCRSLWLSLVAVIALCSCNIDNFDADCCDNLQLTFRYFSDPTSEQYGLINSQSHLLFCEGVLVGKLQVNGSAHGEGLLANEMQRQSLRRLTYTLPKGDYTLHSWGNYTEGTSMFSDTENGTNGYSGLEVGKVRSDDIRLNIVRPSPNNHGAFNGSERLYYGYHKFKVDNTKPICHTVDMLNAHIQLHVTVVWRNVARDVTAKGATLQNVRMRLSDIPTGYLQSNVAQNGKDIVLGFTANRQLFGPREVIEYVPAKDETFGAVSTTMSQVENAKVWGSLISYRLCDSTHPILSLWAADNITRLMKDIDLHRFFVANDWERTFNLRQYYQIQIIIDGDKVEVLALDNIGWIDGGVIGTGIE